MYTHFDLAPQHTHTHTPTDSTASHSQGGIICKTSASEWRVGKMNRKHGTGTALQIMMNGTPFSSLSRSSEAVMEMLRCRIITENIIVPIAVWISRVNFYFSPFPTDSSIFFSACIPIPHCTVQSAHCRCESFNHKIATTHEYRDCQHWFAFGE